MPMALHRFSRTSALSVIVVLTIFFLSLSRLQNGSFRIESALVAKDPNEVPVEATEETEFIQEFGQPGAPPRPPIEKPFLAPGECIPEIETLKKKELGLEGKIVFTRRCVKPIGSTRIRRDDIANISRPIAIHSLPIDLSSCSHVDFVPCDHLNLRVPPPYPQQTYPEFLFGVATEAGRLNASINSFAHWMSGSDAKLVGIITDASGNRKVDLPGLEALFAENNMSAKLIKPAQKDRSVAQHHFTIIRDLLAEVTPETKWIGLLDDDTFFPSLYPLSQALAKFNHSEPAYLGALSEDFQAVSNFGYMAFGGAGVFLSVPLAQALDPLIEKCLDEASGRDGDTILKECIYKNTHAKLTQVSGLYQQDLLGDASGFFEAGPRPLSLHHWKSWYHSPVDRMATVVGMCGDCFLQRWRFGKDTVLTNGFSIAIYRDGVEHLDLDKMEVTWGDVRDRFDFSLGPLRRKMEKEEKKEYRLVDSEVLWSGAFKQFYVYRGDKDKGEADEVIELYWEG